MEDRINQVFERNNYYTGKILSAKDFSMEQEYFNNKRWLLNQYNLGSGILFGLDVLKSGEMRQEECVTIKPGIAIDPSGREIVIREPVNQVLSELDSFSKVKNNGAMYLCIEYEEEKKDKTLSVGDKNSSNHNKVREGYKFVLESEPPVLLNEAAKLLYNIREVYKDEKVVIWHKSPKFVCGEKSFECSFIVGKRVKNVRIRLEYDVEVEKLDKITSRVNFECDDRNEKTEFEEKYWLQACGTDGVISFKNLKVYVGDKVNNLVVEDIEVKNVGMDFKEKILTDYYHEETSQKMGSTGGNMICLAKILLTTVECAFGVKFHIDAVEDTIFTHYIYPQFLQKVMEHEVVNKEEHGSPKCIPIEVKEEVKGVEFTTGVIGIAMSDVYKKAYYTDEIEHGLGPGYFVITTMLEEYESNIVKKVAGNEYAICSGDMEVFNKSKHETLVSGVQIGGILYPKKGTFRIGVKVNCGNKGKEMIWVRWWASGYKEKEQLHNISSW